MPRKRWCKVDTHMMEICWNFTVCNSNYTVCIWLGQLTDVLILIYQHISTFNVWHMLHKKLLQTTKCSWENHHNESWIIFSLTVSTKVNYIVKITEVINLTNEGFIAKLLYWIAFSKSIPHKLVSHCILIGCQCKYWPVWQSIE